MYEYKLDFIINVPIIYRLLVFIIICAYVEGLNYSRFPPSQAAQEIFKTLLTQIVIYMIYLMLRWMLDTMKTQSSHSKIEHYLCQRKISLELFLCQVQSWKHLTY